MTRTLTGTIVRSRKCHRHYAFLELRTSLDYKCQIILRDDDGSMSREEFEDNWRKVKPGHFVQVQVGEVTDPKEKADKPYDVFQTTHIDIITPFPRGARFVTEPPLNTSNVWKDTIKVDGELVPRKDISCRFWINSGKCPKGDECKFRHTQSEDEFRREREAWVRDRLQSRKLATFDPNDPFNHAEGESHGEGKQVKAHRSLLFAKFLIKTFSAEVLDAGEGVLDIAGGRGDVGAFLWGCFEVRSTLVEPVIRGNTKGWIKKLKMVMKRELERQGKLSPSADNGSSKDTDSLEGDKDLMDTPDEDDGPHGSMFEDTNGNNAPMASDAVQSSTYLQGYLRNSPLLYRQLPQHLSPNLVEKYPNLFHEASILIGMHPDQATEPIVDSAISLQKPFAVVPCCVFGHENRHRKLSNGGRVVTTDEFVQYLMEKAVPFGNIEKDYLGFEGRNVVVYWRAMHDD